VTFQRPANALPTPLPTLFQRASHSYLFLATGFQLPAPTHPTPLYARALPLGRDARPSARRGDSHVLAGNGEQTAGGGAYAARSKFRRRASFSGIKAAKRNYLSIAYGGHPEVFWCNKFPRENQRTLGSTMRKIEKNSSAKAKARKLFETSSKSIREIAAAVKVDEKTVRNWKNVDGWVQKSAESPQETSVGEAAAAVVAQLEAVTDGGNIPLPADISRNACITIEALRVHLQTVVQNLHLIRELAEAETDGDENPARARLVAKVLS
jgi:hypothetical protein